MVYCRVNTLTHRSLHLIQLNALYFLSSIQTEDAFKDCNSKNLAPAKYMKLMGLLLESLSRFL